MKTYELTYIVSPELISEQIEAKTKEIESAIQNREGTILKQSNPIAKALSYPIKKRASGFLGIFEFQLEPEKLIELKEILAKDGKIVRHMLIIKEAAELRKERRIRKGAPGISQTKPEELNKYTFETEQKKEKESGGRSAKATVKEKVELKDIEHELDEILGK